MMRCDLSATPGWPMPTFVLAAGLGLVAALPLLLGAWFALRRRPSDRLVGLVAAFGAGALISAVSFELVLDAVERGNPWALGLSLAVGAIVYYAGDRYLSRRSESEATGARGLAILMGAALDGIPESFILGISLAAGSGVSMPFFVAVIVSNLPEGMTSAAELGGSSGYADRRILLMWSVVVGVSAAAAGLGALVADVGPAASAGAQSFAAGALLTMLIDDLVPEARERGGISAGLAAVFGFAVAFALHQLGG